jgi:hypothetical protein
MVVEAVQRVPVSAVGNSLHAGDVAGKYSLELHSRHLTARNSAINQYLTEEFPEFPSREYLRHGREFFACARNGVVKSFCQMPSSANVVSHQIAEPTGRTKA